MVQVSMKKAERLCFTLLTLGILASLSAGIHLQGKGPAGRDDVLVAKEGMRPRMAPFPSDFCISDQMCLGRENHTENDRRTFCFNSLTRAWIIQSKPSEPVKGVLWRNKAHCQLRVQTLGKL